MRRIAIINQKGGVGKTTSTANLGVALARRGQRLLLIDLDPQAHLTLHLGVDPGSVQPNACDVLVRNRPVCEVRRQIMDNLWMLPAHGDLFQAESELISVIGRETILSDALGHDANDYDFILLDCPPSLGILSLNGLCAADEVIIPMQAHFLALQGVGKLLETIQTVQARINPELKVGGVLLCMYDSTTRLGSEVLQDLNGFFAANRDRKSPWSAARVFDTVIRRNIKLAESPSHGQSVLDYAPKSHGAIDYSRLARELLGELTPPPVAARPIRTPAEDTALAQPATALPENREAEDSAVPAPSTSVACRIFDPARVLPAPGRVAPVPDRATRAARLAERIAAEQTGRRAPQRVIHIPPPARPALPAVQRQLPPQPSLASSA